MLGKFDWGCLDIIKIIIVSILTIGVFRDIFSNQINSIKLDLT